MEESIEALLPAKPPFALLHLIYVFRKKSYILAAARLDKEEKFLLSNTLTAPTHQGHPMI